MPTSPALPLTHRLKDATHRLHRRVEAMPFVQRLADGRLAAPEYRRYLAALAPIYEALESALASQAQEPALAAIDARPLARARALEQDLAAWQGASAAGAACAPAASLAYAEHLRALAGRAPSQLLAHVYVRFLGDLHGGQLFKARVARMAALAGVIGGNAFHDFGPPSQVRQLIATLRAGLDAAVLSAHEADGVVAEAVSAFNRHEQLFDQLAPLAPSPSHDVCAA